MKAIFCIVLALLPLVIECTSSCSGVSATAEDSCVFPSNGNYKCYDVANPTYVTVSSGASITFNNDCVNIINGETSGCIFQASSNLLCVKAIPDSIYVFSFTATNACHETSTASVTVTVPSAVSGAQCVDADTCINSCPEETCPGVRYDLATENGVVVGYVTLKNKLNWEVSMEVITFEGSVPNRGWWITGLVFTIGSKRTVKEFAFGNEKTRWFEVISFKDAFPLDTIPCGGSVSVLVVVEVTNDKRNTNRVKQNAYIGNPCEAPSKRTFPLPPDVDCYRVDYDICCECTIRTQSQNDWGNLCTLLPQRTFNNERIRDAVCTRDHIWFSTESWCFNEGLQVGCDGGYSLTFTSPFALANYLADETTPRVLTQNYVDPPHASLGGLAAETASLQLNLKLDECSADWSSSCTLLRTLAVSQHPNNPSRTQCEPFWGLTVGEIFDQANAVLGGCTQGNAAELYTCVRYINRQFVDGKRLWQNPDFDATGSCGVAPS